MAKKNKPFPKQPEAQTPIVEEVKETVEVKEEPEIVDGLVDGVDSMLNIRSTPEVKEGNVVMQLKKGTKLKVVDPKKAKEEPWYKIIVTDHKTEGYAMKKYIKII